VREIIVNEKVQLDIAITLINNTIIIHIFKVTYNYIPKTNHAYSVFSRLDSPPVGLGFFLEDSR
jgi:hypothetical protein